MDLITARKKLETYGQEHLLRYYDTLTEAEKASLLSEIEATDLSVLEAFGKASEAALPNQKFEPLPAVTIAEIAASTIVSVRSPRSGRSKIELASSSPSAASSSPGSYLSERRT